MSNLYKTIRISAETHDLLARQGDLRTHLILLLGN